MSEVTRVPSVADMSDEILIKHFEARHGEDVTINLSAPEPDRAAKGLPLRLRSGVTWRTFHDKMHELYDGRIVDGEPFYNHIHKEANHAD